MVYVLRHKESGKFTSYSGSNKIPSDSKGFVTIEYAQTLATEASARASLKQLISSRAHFRTYGTAHKWFPLFVEAHEMEILEASLQILRVVE